MGRRRHRLGAAGIGEFVEIDDGRIGFGDELPDHRRADESSSPRHQNLHGDTRSVIKLLTF